MNKEILEMMNKKIEAQYFLNQVEVLDQVDITSMISVVFGYPIETHSTINETFQMCKDAGIYPAWDTYYRYLLLECMIMLKNGHIVNEDRYLDLITERQDLCVNMTKMSDEEVKAAIAEGAENLNKHLKIGLDKNKLLRTGGYNKHTITKRLKLKSSHKVNS